MEQQPDQFKEMHFKPIYNYVIVISLIVLGYVIAVTFLPIPIDNIRFVDISFGFLLNLLAQNASYLTGGTPLNTSRRPETPVITGDSNASDNIGSNQQPKEIKLEKQKE